MSQQNNPQRLQNQQRSLCRVVSSDRNDSQPKRQSSGSQRGHVGVRHGGGGLNSNENRTQQQPYRGGWRGRDGVGRRHNVGWSPYQRGFEIGGTNPRFYIKHEENGKIYNPDNHSSHQESGLWNQSTVEQPRQMGRHTEHSDPPIS